MIHTIYLDRELEDAEMPVHLIAGVLVEHGFNAQADGEILSVNGKELSVDTFGGQVDIYAALPEAELILEEIVSNEDLTADLEAALTEAV